MADYYKNRLLTVTILLSSTIYHIFIYLHVHLFSIETKTFVKLSDTNLNKFTVYMYI